MAYIRFKIPAFDRYALKDMDWQAPSFIGDDEIARLIAARNDGDANVYGVYPVMPSDALFDRFSIRGDNRHAVMCARCAVVVGHQNGSCFSRVPAPTNMSLYRTTVR